LFKPLLRGDGRTFRWSQFPNEQIDETEDRYECSEPEEEASHVGELLT
jgi:hypothetical protein